MNNPDMKHTGAGDLLSSVLNMNEMVDYQNGAVVSREIVNKKSGTITLFAFDEKQGLSEHSAPFDALVYIIDGKAEITIDKKNYSLTAGEFIIMPANIPHAVKSLSRFKMLLILIRD